MGAFWNLFAPVTIQVTMPQKEFAGLSKHQSVLPQPFCKDFLEIHRQKQSESYPGFGAIHNIHLTYRLSEENLGEIKAFLNEAWRLIETAKPSLIRKGLELFIKDNLTPLEISGHLLDHIDKQLLDWEDNYYLRYMSVPDMVVHHGWPKELYSNSRRYTMEGFIFLYSREKMNLIPEETVLFYNLKDQIRKELSGKYLIAEYIYTLGF